MPRKTTETTNSAFMNALLSDSEIASVTTRLSGDLKQAARTLTQNEVRFLVDAYYMMQRDRIRAGNQQIALSKAAEPNSVIGWLATQRSSLEKQIARALDAYSAAHPAGEWARSITGIGPVIAAGLLAHIDITEAPTAGHIWRFAGLDPTSRWEKGQKRPWNASLKRLCFLIGESFVKVSGLESDVYGKIYASRKKYEQAKNEAGEYADQARESLKTKNFGADTDARKWYEQGKLPPARIHLRAKRYAVKLFLAHLHHVLYELQYGKPAPVPYVLSEGVHQKHPALATHTTFLAPPNWKSVA